jgi:hypothetical protein
MDENWGWLSTYFLNRTVPWAMSFGNEIDPFLPRFVNSQEQFKPILDNPNILMVRSSLDYIFPSMPHMGTKVHGQLHEFNHMIRMSLF